MTKESANELAFYNELLSDIKQRIQQGQTRAALSANAEMLVTYWDIGRMRFVSANRKRAGGQA